MPEQKTVINIYGGPGVGKSTTALQLVAELKKRGINADYVSEYAKELVYAKSFSKLDGSVQNQREIFHKQKSRLDITLEGVEVAVTDAPLLLNAVYLKEKSNSYTQDVLKKYNEYKNFNIFIERDLSTPFETEGRIHNLKESIEKDAEIISMLHANRIPFQRFDRNNIAEIAETISKARNQEPAKVPVSETAPNRERIFVDMDGVLAKFNHVQSEEELYEKGYFANLKPLPTVVDGMKRYIKENPDKEIYILSAYLTESPYALQEKNEWLDRYLPEISSDHRIFCPCGKSKADYIIGGIQKTDILIDDYTKNLTQWKEQGGIGVKLLNGINHTRGTWQGYSIDYREPIHTALENLMNQKQPLQKSPSKTSLDSSCNPALRQYQYDDGISVVKEKQSHNEEKTNIKKKPPVLEERIKAATDQIMNGIEDLYQSDRWRQYLSFVSAFHQYSPANVRLIMAQCPNATFVAGFNRWKTLGRHVKKGASGIAIWGAPVKKKIAKRDEKDNPILDANGNEIKGQTDEMIYFPIVAVYDVTQTDGEPIPQIAKRLEGASSQLQFAAIETISPYPIRFEQISGDCNGYCNYKEQSIAVNIGMSAAQTAKTALHEVVHARLHNGNSEKSRQQKEIEAESVCYIVADHFGLDTSGYSFDYIGNWAQGMQAKELFGVLENIQEAAKILISDLDAAIENLKVQQQIKEVSTIETTPESTLEIPAEHKSEPPVPNQDLFIDRLSAAQEIAKERNASRQLWSQTTQRERGKQNAD